MSNNLDNVKYISKIGLLAIVISAIFLVFSYLGTGFTTNDDTRYEVATYMYENFEQLYNYSLRASQEQGRIQHILSHMSIAPPHWTSAFLGYSVLNLFNLVAIFTSLSLFALVTYQVTQQKLFAIFIAIFYLIAIQNSWDHNVLTSYTFPMNLGISLLLVSMSSFLQYLSSGKRFWWGLSVTVFLLTLFVSYEFYLFYIMVFIFITIYSTKITVPNQSTALKKFYILTPHFISIAIFLIAYFTYRKFFPGSYVGLNIAQFSLSKTLSVIYQYTIASFPTYIYFHYAHLFDTYSDLISGHSYTISNFLEQLKAEWLVKSIVVSYFVYALLKSRLVVISSKMFIGLVVVSVYVMLVPNLLVAITDRHQTWTTSHGALLYTTTYFSYFGTVLFLTSLVIFLNQLLFGDSKIKLVIRQLYIVLITVGIAFISFVTDYSNYYVFKEQKLSQYKWKTVDTFVQAGNLQNVPTGSFVYAPSLWQAKGIVANHPPYWSEYLRLKYKKDITVSSSLADLQKRVAERGTDGLFYLKFSQEYKDYNQFILFAKVDNLSFSQNQQPFPLASEAKIFSNSKHLKFTIFGRVLSDNKAENSSIVETVTVDGTNANYEGNIFSSVLDKKSNANYVSIPIIAHGKLLDLESISLSNYIDHKLLPVGDLSYSPLNLDFGKGFSGEEKSDKNIWRWSEKESELSINNSSKNPITVLLSTKFVTPGDKMTAIKIEGDLINEEVINQTQNIQDYSKKLTVPPGKHTIKFSTTAKQLISPDPRKIFFGLHDYRLDVLKEDNTGKATFLLKDDAKKWFQTIEEKAKSSYKLGNFEVAKVNYLKHLNLSEQLGDQKAVAEDIVVLLEIYEKLREFSHGLELVKQLFQTTPTDSYSVLEKLYRKNLVLNQHLNNIEEISHAHVKLIDFYGSCYFKNEACRNDLENDINLPELIEQAYLNKLEFANNNPDYSKQMLADDYLQLGYFYSRTKNWSKVKDNYQKALDLYTLLDDKVKLIEIHSALLNYSMFSGLQHNLRDEIETRLKIVELCKATGNLTQLETEYQNLIDLYELLNEHEQAQKIKEILAR